MAQENGMRTRSKSLPPVNSNGRYYRLPAQRREPASWQMTREVYGLEVTVGEFAAYRILNALQGFLLESKRVPRVFRRRMVLPATLYMPYSKIGKATYGSPPASGWTASDKAP